MPLPVGAAVRLIGSEGSGEKDFPSFDQDEDCMISASTGLQTLLCP